MVRGARPPLRELAKCRMWKQSEKKEEKTEQKTEDKTEDTKIEIDLPESSYQTPEKNEENKHEPLAAESPEMKPAAFKLGLLRTEVEDEEVKEENKNDRSFESSSSTSKTSSLGADLLEEIDNQDLQKINKEV